LQPVSRSRNADGDPAGRVELERLSWAPARREGERIAGTINLNLALILLE
jgi:hypothetical protein